MDLDEHSKTVCKNLLADLITVNQGNSSIKFFRKDLTTMLIWLYVMDSYANEKKINIEDSYNEQTRKYILNAGYLRMLK